MSSNALIKPAMSVNADEVTGPRPVATTAPLLENLSDLHPRSLRCFVAVGEQLHFSRAADQLFIPQPWLSRTIRQLEHQIGAPLFVRSTRSVRLTPEGQRLLPAAREVLQALDAIGRVVGARRAELRIPHVAGHDTAMLVLDRLAAGAAETTVEELTLDDNEQLAAVMEGRIDVAVCRLPDTLPPRAKLCRELLRLDPVLVAMRRGETDPPQDIDLRRARVALAAGTGHHSIEDRLAVELEPTVGHPLPRVRVAPGSGTEIAAFERAGEGAFLSYESALLRDPRYTRVAAAPVQPLVAWWLVWRQGSDSPVVRSFLDAARTVARDRLRTNVDAVDAEVSVLGTA
jgi:DNA-binding transcriptional LysR family regulator